MSEKRRDNRGRILRGGESQRQDGRYAYKYKDLNGEYKFVYSWRLDKNDRTPAGRARELSLREKERQIQQDLFKKIVPNGGDLTVLDLVEKYLSLEVNVRHNTQANYNFVLNIIKKEDFGKLRIDKVKQSDAKAWLIKMQKVDGRGYSSIHSIRGVVRPAFEMALQDDLIHKNPFQFKLATVVVNDSVTREAISRAQERAFLKFIQEDKCYSKYYDGIFILFNTGLRVSEFCGLTISDIDFKKKHIRTKYNKIYRIQLPKITPHVCRHTFCSNTAKSGMTPKTLQYIMGHSDIGITLGTYTHLKIEDAQEEFDRCLEA